MRHKELRGELEQFEFHLSTFHLLVPRHPGQNPHNHWKVGVQSMMVMVMTMRVAGTVKGFSAKSGARVD